jgi:hypothetical protein
MSGVAVAGEVVAEVVCARCSLPMTSHGAEPVRIRNAAGSTPHVGLAAVCPGDAGRVRAYSLRPLPLLPREDG